MDEPTWENEEFRCSICLSIFSPLPSHQHEPLVICDNLHTICRTCLAQHLARSTSCPQCRIPCRGTDAAQVNRFVSGFLERVRMRCGSCALPDLLGHGEIARHVNECPGSKVLCPFPHTVSSGRACHQVVTASGLWEHCRSVHSTEVHTLECAPCPDGGLTASLTLPLSVAGLQNIFVSLTAQAETLNLCVHVYVMNDDDGRSVVCLATRRFYSEQRAAMGRILLSLEVGEIFGVVLPLKQPLPPHAELHAHDVDQVDDVVRLPVSVLRAMQDDKATEALKVTATVQFFVGLRGG
jgi:hypothetical protein